MSQGSHATGAMRRLDDVRGHRGAGLVLLWAEEHASLPAAWRLTRGGATVVGREAGADLVLPVAAVSRRHAEVRSERGRWWVRDLGSTNGTFVDGQRVEEAELEHGSELRIGDALLKLVEEDATPYTRYRLDGTMTPGASREAPGSGLVGGWQMDRIAADLWRVAPTQLSVLILGESGTGKEVAARELHERSGRRGAFVAVNCAAIPANLIESELFGYRKGAFSGAEREHRGLIRAAHEGTLLLDEIGDMPLEAQAKLLRVIQAREVLPLGSSTPERVDLRVVAATHRDLGRLQRDGRFREDLFGRLHEHAVRLPPLRERKEDLPLLLRTFLGRHGRPELTATFEFMLGLVAYDWPYNVRELEALVKRGVALAQGSALLPEHLPEAAADAARHPAGRRPTEGNPPSGPLRASPPSREELVELLQQHQGNVAAVGREFGKARMQVHRWMKQHGIDIADFRGDG